MKGPSSVLNALRKGLGGDNGPEKGLSLASECPGKGLSLNGLGMT